MVFQPVEQEEVLKFTSEKKKAALVEFNRRATFSIFFILLVFGVLIIRLWTLQFAERERYLRLAQENYLRLVKEPALRGRILDRQGEALADNVSVYDLVVNWVGIPRRLRQESIQQVAELLETTPEKIQARLKRITTDHYGDRVLMPELDFELVVAAREAQIPGVEVRQRPLRYYPYGSTAAHLLGYLGEISEQELEQHENYEQGTWVGKMGLERLYEFNRPVLRGQDGYREIQVYANGLIDREIAGAYQPPVPGKDITTTLDLELQLAAEEILGASRGAIVALDPRNGDVLAMVSHPTFDPNVFVRISRKGERAQALRNQYNLALNGSYAMGSVFKIVVSTAALEENTVTPEDTFFCGGRIPVGGGYKHCHIWWNYKYGHGDMDMRNAIMRSCDVYFYQVGKRLGHEKIIEYSRRVFGLIDPPGMRYRAEGDEEPFTLTGEYPDPGRVLRAHLMRGPRRWYLGNTLNLSIGQGELSSTPLQVAVLMAVAANGGSLWQPRLVKRISEMDGRLVKEFPPKLVSKAEISEETLRVVHDGLDMVMSNRRGTGYRNRVEGLQVLGKTGTAETGREETDAWFGCFAPGDNPEIAIAVVVPHSGHGGDIAAPIAKALLETYFADRLATQVTQVEAGEGRR